MTNLVQYEYEGNVISFEIDEEIMINATQMAKPFGKKVKDFLRLKQTKNYLNALEQGANLPLDSILIVKHGGVNHGTWMHQELALKFASWLNPKIEV